MFEEDQETLAAEYVLGTLSAEEREHAEALRSFDPEFDAAVKQWERRLGELNVMVEAVEPPAEVWDKIKGEIGAEMPAEADAAADTESVPDLESPATVDATDFLFAEAATTQPEENAGEASATAANDAAAPPPLAAKRAPSAERGADVVRLRRRVGRWRGFTVAFAAIAAVAGGLYRRVEGRARFDTAATARGRREPDGANRAAGAGTGGPAGRRLAADPDRAGLPAHGRYPATHRRGAPYCRRAGERPQL